MWVPPSIERELRDEEARSTAEMLAMVEAREDLAEWNAELKAIDPYLELVFAPEGVTAPGLVPGRFHIIRHNPTGSPSPFPLLGPGGTFVEPNSSLFNALAESDLWDGRVLKERKELAAKAQAARERRRQREREDRVEEMALRLKAANNPGILFSDTPWTARVPGRLPADRPKPKPKPAPTTPEPKVVTP